MGVHSCSWNADEGVADAYIFFTLSHRSGLCKLYLEKTQCVGWNKESVSSRNIVQDLDAISVSYGIIDICVLHFTCSDPPTSTITDYHVLLWISATSDILHDCSGHWIFHLSEASAPKEATRFRV